MGKYVAWLTVVILIFSSTAWAQKSAFTGRETPTTPAAPTASGQPVSGDVASVVIDPVELALAGLDVRDKVGQLMMVTLEGTYQPSVGDLAFLQACMPGAAIIRRVLKPSHAATYVERVRGIEGLTGIPIWVGANLAELATRERGVSSGFVQLPSPLAVGATRDLDCVDKLGLIMGEHMSGMGFDLHLGPAFYLAPSVSGAAGTLSTFGSDPAWVAQAGTRLIARLQDYGVLAVPMGFPGGGADRVGRAPAMLLTPRMHLAKMDLMPYAAAIAQGAPALHVGPTQVPGIDPGGAPACASKVVISDILRGELGYEGVVIAGPVDSTDVAANMDPVEAGLRALQFGADMVYWRSAGPAQLHAVERVVQAVTEGAIAPEIIDRAVRRVLACKFAHRIEARDKVNTRAAARLENQKDLLRETFDIERKSITLVKNSGNILPLSKAGSMPLGVTGVVGVEGLKDALEKDLKPISQQSINSARHLGDIQEFEIQRIASRIRGIRTVVCVLTDQIRVQGMVRLVRALKAAGPKVVVVYLGYPAALAELSDADAIVLAYCDTATYDQSLLAVSDVLLGQGAIDLPPRAVPLNAKVGEMLTYDVADVARSPVGMLPVRVSERFPVGLGLSYDLAPGIKSVEWDFGDGVHEKGVETTHAYGSAGQYTLQVQLTDVRKQTREQRYEMVVEP